MIELSIKTLKQGACLDRFDRALAELVANVLDPNTDPKAKRSVTLTLSVKPNEARNMADITVAVASKLQPAQPLATGCTLGTNLDTGEVAAFEIVSNSDADGPLMKLCSPVDELKKHMEPGDAMTVSFATPEQALKM